MIASPGSQRPWLFPHVTQQSTIRQQSRTASSEPNFQPETFSMNAASLPDLATAATMKTAAIGQIQWARQYTMELLEATPMELWFEMPDGLPTHIAWQVGHLAYSQYGLCLFRIRGREPEDLDIVPGVFRKKYARSSTPNPDASKQPSPDELLERLNVVHDRAIAEITSMDDAVLLEPVEMPFAVYPAKIGCLLFCPLHEQIHSGQIGLLRRALGLASVR